MQPGLASQTAHLTAAYRGRASVRPGALFSDPWAAALAGPEGAELARRYDEVNPHAELWLAVRTAFLDDLVLERTRGPRAIEQVVLLGAGLDTRAARLGRPGLRFFEVDARETQTRKLARLASQAGYPREAAAYVSCDFEREDFLERLAEAGFRADAPALFLWEGVTYYLTEPAVRATLRRVAEGCHEASLLVFDYVGKRLVEGRRIDERQREMIALLGALGEPFHFGINDPLPMLFEEGFRHIRTVSFAEACLSLTGTYERERQFRFQWFALARRAPPPRPVRAAGAGVPGGQVAR